MADSTRDASVQASPEDSEVYSEFPLTDKLLRWIAVGLAFALLSTPMRAIRELLVICALSVIVTGGVRSRSSGGIWEILLVIIVGISMFVGFGVLLAKSAPALERLIFGPPAYGRKLGPPGRLLFTTIRLSFEIRYTLRRRDWLKVKAYNEADTEITETLLKHQYVELVRQGKADGSPADIDAAWTRKWNDEILETGPGALTLRKSLAIDNLGSRVLNGKLTGLVLLSQALNSVVFTTLIFLVYAYLSDAIGLVTLVQLCLPILVIGPLFVYIMHSHQHGQLVLGGPLVEVPDELATEIEGRLDGLIGATIRPAGVKVGKRYISIMRGFLGPIVAKMALLNGMTILLVIGMVVALAFALPDLDYSGSLPWYRDLIVGTIVVVVAMPVVFYVSFWVLQNFRQLLAPVAAGLLVAGLPYAVQFVTTGQVRFEEAINRVLGASGFVVTGFIEAVASRVRKVTEDSDLDAADSPLLEVVD